MMEQSECHRFLKVFKDEIGEKSVVFRLIMSLGLDVRAEQTAENTLDFDPRGVHANRFQLRV
jgi:hypothetical protein